ncbi:MAG: glycosyltransferase family 4 protein [Candidatus Aminicenantales bacterium]
MSILLLTPNWQAKSEVWIQYSIEANSDNIACIVANNTQGNRYWRNQIRAVSLSGTDKLLNRMLWRAGFYTQQKTLMREIRRKEVSRILCHYGTTAVNFFDVWNQTDKPLFVHFHGYDATFNLCPDDNPDKLYHRTDYKDKLISISKHATCIANSHFTKKLLISAGLPDERIVVKYLGVPIPQQTKNHIEKKEIHILQLGRLIDSKSPDRTIRAFEMARANGLKARLTIAGDGPLRPMCELMRLRSPYKEDIFMPGAVTAQEAQELFFDADIYTQHNITGEITNQAESFGVTIIEAMAAGLPVLGTKSGAVPETVVDGETGILIEPGNVEAQAANMCLLARNVELRKKMGLAGRTRVIENFTSEIEANKLKEIMNI